MLMESPLSDGPFVQVRAFAFRSSFESLCAGTFLKTRCGLLRT